MTTFFYIAGVVVTILGIAAIAIIPGVYIAVRYFGLTLTFGNIRQRNDEK